MQEEFAGHEREMETPFLEGGSRRKAQAGPACPSLFTGVFLSMTVLLGRTKTHRCPYMDHTLESGEARQLKGASPGDLYPMVGMEGSLALGRGLLSPL